MAPNGNQDKPILKKNLKKNTGVNEKRPNTRKNARLDQNNVNSTTKTSSNEKITTVQEDLINNQTSNIDIGVERMEWMASFKEQSENAMREQELRFEQMNASWAAQIKHENRLLQIRNLEREEHEVMSYNIPQPTPTTYYTSTTGKMDIKSMLRIMSTYSGDKSENFEGWLTQLTQQVWNTQLLLSKYNMTEDDKITTLLLAVKGVAREILQGCDRTKDVKSIYEVLEKTYGRDRSTLMAQSRQLPEESVLMYLGKLKSN